MVDPIKPGTHASTSHAERMRMRLNGRESPPVIRAPPEIPDHTLIRPIGSGSYGEVWLARNVMGSYRAVKIVYLDAFSDERPYEREFEGIRKFEPISRSADGFVHILQIGRNDLAGCFYCVMELADDSNISTPTPALPRPPEKQIGGKRGRVSAPSPGSTTSRTARVQPPISSASDYRPMTLAELRRQHGRLPAADCADLGLALTGALAHLHAHGLLHRDIKPSNIIFVNGVPKLADIGLVAETDEARSFVGTEGFIPPEGPNSPQSDIYSLGKVLYEITMGRDRHDFPEPFSGLWEAPEAEFLLELNAVILKACATNRPERYRTADEMEADLALVQSGRSVRHRRALRSRLRRLAKVTAAIALLALTALGMNSWLEYRVEQLQARPTVGAGRLAGRIPAREAGATLNQLDLAAHYNVLLDEQWFGPPGNDLAMLPRGLQAFGDVTFDLRGVIQLASSGVPMAPGIEFSRGAHGLNVGFRCEQLHFLHGTISGAGEGQEIGRYVVHYADAARRIVPIRYGMEVRDYWGWTGPGQETANAVVAWRGENAATRERGFTLRLYRTTWQNPIPHVPIASLDFVASGSSSAPFLLAVTADPHAASEPVFEPDLIDEIQAHAAHYQGVRVSRAFGQPAFRTVRLNTEGRRAGAAYYDAIRVTTPPEPGWDLVWVTTFVGLASCDAWQISPVEGAMRVGFEDWYHGSRAHYRDLPRQEGRQDLALQYLDGRKLRPRTEYLIWFSFNDNQPVDLRLAITFVPPGQVSPGRPDLLEAALGLERIDHVQDTDDMTLRTNCGPGLHRHFCLGASHW